MKTFLHIVCIFIVILLQGLLFIGIVGTLFPASPEKCRTMAKLLSSSKTPFASASRYYYAQAKRNDPVLEADLAEFQNKLAEHNYQQADLIRGKICERYPDYSNLAEQLQQSQQEFQTAEAGRAETAFHAGKYDKALSHLENADMTVSSVQYMLGYIHLHFQQEIDYSKARRFLEMALEQNEVKAAYELGGIYETGKGVDIDTARAISYYEQAYQGNIKDALPKLAELNCRPEIADNGNAIKYNQLLADDGDAVAMYRLAGLTLAQDSYQGKQWTAVEGLYRTAASKGYLPAKETMASLYLKAKITTVDVSEQKKYYLLMAEKGNVEYQMALAELYSGESLPNRHEALSWFLKAAGNGNATACYRAAQCYEKGVGTETDLDRAVSLYRQAAGQGHQEAVAWIQRYDEQQRIAAEKKAAEEKKQREEARKRAEILAKKQWLEHCFADFNCCASELASAIGALDSDAFQKKLPELTDIVITGAYNSKAYLSGIGNFSCLSDIPLKHLLDRRTTKTRGEELEELIQFQHQKKCAEVLSNLMRWKIAPEKMASASLERIIKDALKEKYPIYKTGDHVKISARLRRREITINGVLQQVGQGAIKIGGRMYQVIDLPDSVLRHFNATLNDKLINREYIKISRLFEEAEIANEIDQQEILGKGYIPNTGTFRSYTQANSANHWETVFELRTRIAEKLQKCFEKYIAKADFSDMIDGQSQ